MQNINDEEKSLSRFLDILAILFTAVGCLILIIFIALSIYFTLIDEAFAEALRGWIFVGIGFGGLLMCLFMTGVLFGINRIIANTKMIRIRFQKEEEEPEKKKLLKTTKK